jgi:hypothetical protein
VTSGKGGYVRETVDVDHFLNRAKVFFRELASTLFTLHQSVNYVFIAELVFCCMKCAVSTSECVPLIFSFCLSLSLFLSISFCLSLSVSLFLSLSFCLSLPFSLSLSFFYLSFSLSLFLFHSFFPSLSLSVSLITSVFVSPSLIL